MSDINSAKSLSFAGAQRVLAAAVAASEGAGLAMCIAVVDHGGEPIVTARMDGAARISGRLALDKAYTVTGFLGVPTSAWWEMIKDDPAVLHGIPSTERLVIFGGGVPIISGGELVGAIGVSGGSADQDAEIAAAAAAVIN